MTLTLVKALMILNVRGIKNPKIKGWTDEARKKSAATRKAKKKVTSGIIDKAKASTTQPGAVTIKALSLSKDIKGHDRLETEFGWKITNRIVAGREKSLKKETVPISSLRTKQDWVYKSTVESKLKKTEGPILVVRENGKNYLWDGTHRTVASMVKGRKKIEARILDVKDLK